MIIFLGKIDGKKKFRCLCNSTKIYDAGDHLQNAENHLAGRDHFFAFRQHAFSEKVKDQTAWLQFAVGNPKSKRFLATYQNKKRKQVSDAKRGFALDPGAAIHTPHQQPVHQPLPVYQPPICASRTAAAPRLPGQPQLAGAAATRARRRWHRACRCGQRQPRPGHCRRRAGS